MCTLTVRLSTNEKYVIITRSRHTSASLPLEIIGKVGRGLIYLRNTADSMATISAMNTNDLCLPDQILQLMFSKERPARMNVVTQY